MELEYYHSVTLNEENCRGCTNCIKRCPTQAIRVRGGRAKIIPERCVDCGECVRVCPHKAKQVVTHPLVMMERFRHTIALPAPALYGQFNNLSDIDYVLTGLLDLGFDSVWEVSRAAELVSDATRQMMRRGEVKTPVISSACPAVVRLVRARFADLCDQVLPMCSPMQIAARRANLAAQAATGLSREEIGVFFITPCPAKATDIVEPVGLERSWVNGALSMAEVYPKLVERMNRITTPRPLAKSGIIGVSWANSGGEASALLRERYLAADGIENVIAVLEQLEDHRLGDLDFVELNACPGGCVGGVLTVQNPYVAKARIQHLRKFMPVSLNHIEADEDLTPMRWSTPLNYVNIMRLHDDLRVAMQMMQQVEGLRDALPDLDCGACGAPSCQSLAEDIVKGFARLNDCIYILREEALDAGLEVSRVHGDGGRGKDKPHHEEETP